MHQRVLARPPRVASSGVVLADEDDRSADITLQSLIDELRQAEIEPFPVANDVVSRVSLGVLAALNDELSS